ncbi:MAG: Cys-Gln thioester bond-forming surface protein [Bacilli bacterium]|nr:Cys-Gln thioester bond-forming surface protein [Bacilli bacterium]
MKKKIIEMVMLFILGIFITPLVASAESTAHISGSDSYEKLPSNFKLQQYAGKYTYQSKNQIDDTIANGDSVAKIKNGVLTSTAMISILYDMDTGEWVYCLQPSTELKDGYLYQGYSGEEALTYTGLTEEQRTRIHLIAYFGFGYQDSNHNHMARIWYSVAQKMIWETAGYEIRWLYDVYDSTSYITKYTAEEAEIESLINEYNNSFNVSFGKDEYEIDLGETLTITEIHNNLAGFKISSQSDGLNARIDGNSIIINPSKVGKYFTLSLEKEYKYFEAPSIIYHRNDSQDVFKVGYLDPVDLELTINVNGGKIAIHKVDSKTNTNVAQGSATLKDAKYGIYDSNDNLIYTLTTDGNGYAISDYLPKLDTYKVKEISSSKGYNLDDNVYYVDVDSSGTYDVNVPEKVIENYISILKQYDFVDGNTTFLNAEEGITFEIYDSSNQKYKEIVTDKNGYATTALPYGVYRFHQVNSHTGFEKIYDFYVTVDENSEKEQYYNILNNKISAYLQVYKIDQETGNVIALAGTEFKILNTDTNQYVSQYVSGHVYDTFVTDEDGKFMTYLKLESGNYKLIEVSSPTNYLLNDNGLDFSIGEDTHFAYTTYGAVVTLRFSDKAIKGKIEVHKTGESVIINNGTIGYEEIPLKDTKFNVYASEDILSADGNYLYYSKDQLVDTITTDGNGYAISKELYLGSYYIVEVSTNYDYVLDSEPYYFTLTAIDNKTSIVYESYSKLNKIKKGTLNFSKLDFSDSNPLPNTKIEVYTDTNLLIWSGITDEFGKIVINDIPKGKYCILEKEAPEGYILNEEKMCFEIKDNNEVIKSTMLNKKIEGSLEFSKLDFSTNEPIPNTRIEIYKIVEDKDELVFEGLTDDKGQIIIEELEYGKYYILEKATASSDYILNEEKMYFEILEDGEVIKATMFNDRVIIEVPDTLLNEFDYKSYIAITFILAGVGLIFYESIKKDKNNI